MAQLEVLDIVNFRTDNIWGPHYQAREKLQLFRGYQKLEVELWPTP